MSKSKTRRLTQLKVDEISAVDRGAGEGVRIALIKRAPFAFNDAASLVKSTKKRAKAKHKKAAKFAEKELLKLMQQRQHIEPLEEEQLPMQTVSKAISDMNTRIEAIMKADPTIRSRESAISRVCASPDAASQACWRAYKAEGYGVSEPVVEPEPITKSAAYLTIEQRAAEFHKSHPHLSEAQCFARIYEAPGSAQLRELDRAHHFSKLGATGEPAEPAARPSSSRDIIDREVAEHLRKSAVLDAEAVAKATSAGVLHANLLAALAASYPGFSRDRLESIARTLAQRMPDLGRIGRDRGFKGSAA